MLRRTPAPDCSATRYVASVQPGVTREEFLARAGVRSGSYAADVALRVYEAAYMVSLDLGADYKEFYEVEYATFAQFLCKRCLMDRESSEAFGIERKRPVSIVQFDLGDPLFREEAGEEIVADLLATEEEG